MRALLREARAAGIRVVIPAGVLGQVWRDPGKQVAIGGLTKAAETTVIPLDKVLEKLLAS
jgi:hypothetical protein